MRDWRRVVIIGRNGQLARDLAKSAWPSLTALRFLGRSEVDLFDPGRLHRQIAAAAPDAIINTAAYTAVDRAEQEAERAFLLNATAAGYLARSAAALHIPLIHVSTDYVFDGSKECAYCESDTPAPLSVYGRSKAAGEGAVAAAGGTHVILRSSWFFGLYGNNFLKTMLRLGRERRFLSVVNDQFGRPTPVSALASVLQRVTVDLIEGRSLPTIIHYAGDQQASWFDFAQEIFIAARDYQIVPQLSATTSAEFNAPAPRPRNSVLDCGLAESLGLRPADWRGVLPSLIKTLMTETAGEVGAAA